MDIFTNIPKASVNICIGISHDLKAQAVQILCAIPIVGNALRFIVLRTVDLNDKLCGCAVKIDNVLTNNALFIYFYRI